MVGKLLGPEEVHLEEWREPPGLHPEVADATDPDILSAFTYGTTNKALVHELGHRRPRTTVDLLNIATKFTDGEDVVGAIFRKGKGPCDAGEPSTEKRDRRNIPTSTGGTTILGVKKKLPPRTDHPGHRLKATTTSSRN